MHILPQDLFASMIFVLTTVAVAAFGSN